MKKCLSIFAFASMFFISYVYASGINSVYVKNLTNHRITVDIYVKSQNPEGSGHSSGEISAHSIRKVFYPYVSFPMTVGFSATDWFNFQRCYLKGFLKRLTVKYQGNQLICK